MKVVCHEVSLALHSRKGMSEKSLELWRTGVLVGEKPLPQNVLEEFTALIRPNHKVRRANHPTELFDEYQVPIHLALKLMEICKPEIDAIRELSFTTPLLRDDNAVINLTKKQSTLTSSYVFHHDNKLRHYRLILLLDDADCASATRYILCSNRPLRRLLEWRKKQLGVSATQAAKVKELTLEAGRYYCIDTSGWHAAGNPELRRRATVNLCFDPVYPI